MLKFPRPYADVQRRRADSRGPGRRVWKGGREHGSFKDSQNHGNKPFSHTNKDALPFWGQCCPNVK